MGPLSVSFSTHEAENLLRQGRVREFAMRASMYIIRRAIRIEKKGLFVIELRFSIHSKYHVLNVPTSAVNRVTMNQYISRIICIAQMLEFLIAHNAFALDALEPP